MDGSSKIEQRHHRARRRRAAENREQLRAIFVTYLEALGKVRDVSALPCEELVALARRESARDG